MKIQLYNFVTKPFELRGLGNGGDNCAYRALLIVLLILVLRSELLNNLVCLYVTMPICQDTFIDLLNIKS